MNQDGRVPFVYRAFRALGAPFRFRVRGLEHLERAGPAIITANHLGALGPIQAILSVPVRFYPWVIGEMTDPDRAPRYLYDDFVRTGLHLDGNLGMALATGISWLSVRLLKGVDAISIDENRGRIIEGFRRSLELLEAGQKLLIFPEDDRSPADPETGMHPFKAGFAQLCTMHQRATGERVPIYPMAVHAGTRRIAIDRPMFVEDGRDPRQSLERACSELRQRTLALYCRLSASSPET
jgi:1-acyl-sn-glycerol-3-phosphate acyltransferase